MTAPDTAINSPPFLMSVVVWPRVGLAPKVRPFDVADLTGFAGLADFLAYFLAYPNDDWIAA